PSTVDLGVPAEPAAHRHTEIPATEPTLEPPFHGAPRDPMTSLDPSIAGTPAPTPQLATAPRVAGTPLYMPPEIWRGEPATPRSDVYALGVVLYELCAGAPPYGRLEAPELLLSLTKDEAPPLRMASPGVDARLAAIVDRCLRRDPERRF